MSEASPYLEQVLQILSAYTAVGGPDETLDLDSLSLIQLVEELEEEFNILVGAADVVPAHFSSARAIAAFLGARSS